MAILNDIRKHGIFLIIIIALALFAFVLSGVFGNGNSSPKGETTVATINGVDLPREDFMKKVEARQRSLGGNAATNQSMNYVWQQELRRVILGEQYEALGLTAEKEQISNSISLALSNNLAFQNQETGMFDKNVMYEYIANAKASADAGNPSAYNAWLDFENNIANTVLENNYFNLLKGGLITTLAEGEQEYRFQNDNIDIEFIQIPYTKIADEDVPVSEKEIESYIRAHAKDFEVDPQVDIQYISFTEDPSTVDVDAAKTDMLSLISRLKEATDNEEFVNANSEINYTDRWYLKSDLPAEIADDVMALDLNNVHGPFKEGNTYNIVKVFETRQMADSAKARHILIRYQGLQTAPQDVTKSKEEARKLADSILAVVKRNNNKFESLAADFSEDLSNKDKAGELGYFTPRRMVKPFNDYIFDNKIGDIGLVETEFGFHIVEIEDQKNIQKAVKVANILKKIEASEETINNVFSDATRFELAAKDGKFDEMSKEKGYTVKPVNKIGELDATIPGIGENRSIVTWAFNEDTAIGDIKRVNTNNGYVVVQLTRRNPKGLLSIAEASAEVSPILRNKKKAKKIREAISSADLKEVAASQNVTVKTANAVNMASPTIAGAGTEPKVIGAAFGVKAGETTKLVDGINGVYMVKVLKANKAPELEDYSNFANQLNATLVPTINANAYNALKNAADIEDNRADFY